MPYVNQRWLGGMLTNFQTVYKRLQRLKELEEHRAGRRAGQPLQEGAAGPHPREGQAGALPRRYPRHEKVPSAVWIVDTKKEHIAVGEARKLNIPVVAILDTNCDPDEVDYKIPGNDDAIRSIALLTRVIADAVAEGLMARAAAQANAGRDEKPEPGRPSAATSRWPTGSASSSSPPAARPPRRHCLTTRCAPRARPPPRRRPRSSAGA